MSINSSDKERDTITILETLQSPYPPIQINHDLRNKIINLLSTLDLPDEERILFESLVIQSVKLSQVTIENLQIYKLISQVVQLNSVTINNCELLNAKLKFTNNSQLSCTKVRIDTSNFDNSENHGKVEIEEVNLIESSDSTFNNLIFKKFVTSKIIEGKAIINESNFNNCKFVGCTFFETTISKSTFKNCQFANCKFVNCIIIDSDLQQSTFQNSQFFNCQSDKLSKLPADEDETIFWNLTEYIQTLKQFQPQTLSPAIKNKFSKAIHTTDNKPLHVIKNSFKKNSPHRTSKQIQAVSHEQVPTVNINEEITTEAIQEKQEAEKNLEGAKALLAVMLGIEYDAKIPIEGILDLLGKILKNLHFSITQATGKTVPPTLIEIQDAIFGLQKSKHELLDKKYQDILEAKKQEIITIHDYEQRTNGELYRILDLLDQTADTATDKSKSTTLQNFDLTTKIGVTAHTIHRLIQDIYLELEIKKDLPSFKSDLKKEHLTDLLEKIKKILQQSKSFQLNLTHSEIELTSNIEIFFLEILKIILPTENHKEINDGNLETLFALFKEKFPPEKFRQAQKLKMQNPKVDQWLNEAIQEMNTKNAPKPAQQQPIEPTIIMEIDELITD